MKHKKKQQKKEGERSIIKGVSNKANMIVIIFASREESKK